MFLVFKKSVVMNDHESIKYTGKASTLSFAIEYVSTIGDQTRLAAWEVFISLPNKPYYFNIFLMGNPNTFVAFQKARRDL